jgi:Flp pilus assembly protein TadB
MPNVTPTTPSGSLLRLRVAAGLAVDDLQELSPRLRRLVAVAIRVGAPVADALDAGLAAEEDERRAQRAIAIASSQTRMVAGGLLVAPLLLVPGLGRLLGADLLGFYRSPIGLAVLAAGLGLLGLGAAIVVGLLRRVGRPPSRRGRTMAHLARAAAVAVLAWWAVGPVAAAPAATIVWLVGRRSEAEHDPPQVEEAVELVATAQSGGTSTAQALRLAAEQLPGLARPLNRLAFDLEFGVGRGGPDVPEGAGGRAVPALDRFAAVLTAANDVGAPVAPTLRRLAAELRADELARVLAAAERLPAQLTFPTALCLLPGTVLLVGAPIVQAGLAAVGT